MFVQAVEHFLIGILNRRQNGMHMEFKTVIIPIMLMPILMSFQSTCDFKIASHRLIDNRKFNLCHILPYLSIVVPGQSAHHSPFQRISRWVKCRIYNNRQSISLTCTQLYIIVFGKKGLGKINIPFEWESFFFRQKNIPQTICCPNKQGYIILFFFSSPSIICL